VIVVLVRQHDRRYLGEVYAGVEQQHLPAGPHKVGDAGLAPQPGPPCTPVNQRQHAQLVDGADAPSRW
jgi:hypothetical protein